jgi:hypothetical protein
MITHQPDVFVAGIHRLLAQISNNLTFSCENHCQGQSSIPEQITLAVRAIYQMHGDGIRFVLQGIVMAAGSAQQKQLTSEIM